MATPIHLIRDEATYEAYLAEYETYFDNEPEPGSEAGDRFEMLGLVLSRYEDEHFPIRAADPVSTIKAYMDFHGQNQSALADVLGSRSRASEVMNYKRALSVDMIRKVADAWRIPLEVLIRPYPTAGKEA